MAKKIAQAFDLLPETEQRFALELLCAVVRRWDPDFTRLTKDERDRLDRALQDDSCVQMDALAQVDARNGEDDVCCASQAVSAIDTLAPLPGHLLLARFTTGEWRVYSMVPLLERPVFAPLKDERVFRAVRLEYGAPVWLDGAVDLDPECILQGGAPVSWQHEKSE